MSLDGVVRIVRRLERMTARDLERGMRHPTRWDPRFREVMTAADLFRYPVSHMEHHLAQLDTELPAHRPGTHP